MMLFEEYIFKRKVRKLTDAARSRKHKFCSWDAADHVLILYRNEDKGNIEPIVEKLRSTQKQICCCVTCSGVIKEDEPSTIYVNKSRDVDKYGIPNSAVSSRIAEVKADILIDLSRDKCHTLKVLMIQHPSLFKVGERLSDDAAYDFSIVMTDGEGTAELFEYLLFYLQTIRSK